MKVTQFMKNVNMLTGMRTFCLILPYGIYKVIRKAQLASKGEHWKIIKFS